MILSGPRLLKSLVSFVEANLGGLCEEDGASSGASLLGGVSSNLFEVSVQSQRQALNGRVRSLDPPGDALGFLFSRKRGINKAAFPATSNCRSR